MKLVNLSEKEIKEAKKIISKYKELESSLTRVQTQLERLDKERIKLIENLDQTRGKEDQFFTNLRTNYGEGKLDLYTMKYIIEKNDDDTTTSET
jgi:K+/H+ antiporter YhaU regulatory subunit KhtT